MNDLDLKEKLWGGVFGVIAILAALAEMLVNGLSLASVLGAVKDVAGTLVVVVLLVTVVKSMLPKKGAQPFPQRLEAALDGWRTANRNMIVRNSKSNGSEDKYGLSLKTDMNAFYSGTGTNAGVFCRMPALALDTWKKGNIQLEFWLNTGTFFEGRTDLSDADKEAQLRILASKFAGYIAAAYPGFCTASAVGDKVSVTVKDPIQTDEDIHQLLALINSMYQAYLVSANIVVK